MKGMKKVLKFKVFSNYNNARKIADDIIISLMRHSGLEEKEREYAQTFSSTVRPTPFSWLFTSHPSDDNDNIDADDADYNDFIITIYEMKGNRKSKLSVSQNKQLLQKVMDDPVEQINIVTRSNCELYKLRSTIDSKIRSYNMSKQLSDKDSLYDMRSDIIDLIQNLIDELNKCSNQHDQFMSDMTKFVTESLCQLRSAVDE